MESEEALAVIKEAPLYNDTTWEFANKLHEAIETLERELCEDCISRQAVLEQINYWAIGNREYLLPTAMNHLIERMQDLSPVTPMEQPETAQWMSKGDVYPGWKYCSKCYEPWTFDCGLPNYCPKCGRKMESEIMIAEGKGRK